MQDGGLIDYICSKEEGRACMCFQMGPAVTRSSLAA